MMTASKAPAIGATQYNQCAVQIQLANPESIFQELVSRDHALPEKLELHFLDLLGNCDEAAKSWLGRLDKPRRRYRTRLKPHQNSKDQEGHKVFCWCGFGYQFRLRSWQQSHLDSPAWLEFQH